MAHTACGLPGSPPEFLWRILVANSCGLSRCIRHCHRPWETQQPRSSGGPGCALRAPCSGPGDPRPWLPPCLSLWLSFQTASLPQHRPLMETVSGAEKHPLSQAHFVADMNPENRVPAFTLTCWLVAGFHPDQRPFPLMKSCVLASLQK